MIRNQGVRNEWKDTTGVRAGVQAANCRAVCRREQLQGIKQLVINLDNGPECNGRRSKFLHRMTQFADTTGSVCVPALSQQIQRHRAILGGTGAGMKWLASRHSQRRAQSRRTTLLERHANARRSHRYSIRKRRQTLQHRKNNIGATSAALRRTEVVGCNHSA